MKWLKDNAVTFLMIVTSAGMTYASTISRVDTRMDGLEDNQRNTRADMIHRFDEFQSELRDTRTDVRDIRTFLMGSRR